jgi:hypothetical protein
VDPSIRRGRTRWVAIAAGCFAVSAVAGYALTHVWFLPNASPVDWSRACGGHGGRELSALLADSPVTAVSWVSDSEQEYGSANMTCDAQSSDNSVEVSVGSEGQSPSTVIRSVLHSSAPDHESMASARRFAAGDAAEAWPDYSVSAVTCVLPDGATQGFTVTTQLTAASPGTAATRRQLLEDLNREYVAALQATPVCEKG